MGGSLDTRIQEHGGGGVFEYKNKEQATIFGSTSAVVATLSPRKLVSAGASRWASTITCQLLTRACVLVQTPNPPPPGTPAQPAGQALACIRKKFICLRTLLIWKDRHRAPMMGTQPYTYRAVSMGVLMSHQFPRSLNSASSGLME